jgi:hypothetical protein
MGMTISAAAVQGIQSGVSLLNRTADKVANPTPPTASPGDQVTLSADAVALLQAKAQVGASVNVLHVESDIRKTLNTIA